MTIQVLHRDELKLGGFAGLREHRLVMDSKVFGNHAEPGTWSGMGSFVYLADAKFLPNGETHLHPHKEIDVISVIVNGRIAHQGTLEEGNMLIANQVQVQRAGGEGFSHNEVNPDNDENRMIQLWITPEQSGQPAGYKLYDLSNGSMIRVYGGQPEQSETFPSNTVLDVGLLNPNQKISLPDQFLMYVINGSGMIDDQKVTSGDLIRGSHQIFESLDDSEVIVVSTLNQSNLE